MKMRDYENTHSPELQPLRKDPASARNPWYRFKSRFRRGHDCILASPLVSKKSRHEVVTQKYAGGSKILKLLKDYSNRIELSMSRNQKLSGTSFAVSMYSTLLYFAIRPNISTLFHVEMEQAVFRPGNGTVGPVPERSKCRSFFHNRVASS